MRQLGATRGLGLLAMVVLAACGNQSSAPPLTASSGCWLHTKGTTVYNCHDVPVILAGADLTQLIPGRGNNVLTNPDSCGEGWNTVPDSTYQNFADDGFTTVRLGLSWANLEPTAPAGGSHTWNTAYVTTLDKEVEGFTSRGIQVILDMHQNGMSPAFRSSKVGQCEGAGLPTWLYPDPGIGAQPAECNFYNDVNQPGVGEDIQAGYKAAWAYVAGRYKTNDLVVGADMWNEPNINNCPELNGPAFYTWVGTAIRSANPNLLLIYEDRPGESHKQYVMNAPLNMPNSVYSWHIYPATWAEALPAFEAHWQKAQAFDAPLWIGEFGRFHDDSGTDPNWVADLAQMMSYTRSRNIGWAYHEFCCNRNMLEDANGTPLNPTWVATMDQGVTLPTRHRPYLVAIVVAALLILLLIAVRRARDG